VARVKEKDVPTATPDPATLHTVRMGASVVVPVVVIPVVVVPVVVSSVVVVVGTVVVVVVVGTVVVVVVVGVVVVDVVVVSGVVVVVVVSGEQVMSAWDWPTMRSSKPNRSVISRALTVMPALPGPDDDCVCPLMTI
jgi:hypothetical protein